MQLDTLHSPDFVTRLIPAPEVREWLQAEILADTSSIHNEDRAHLIDADVRGMWASAAFTKKGRAVVGQTEQVAFRAGGLRLGLKIKIKQGNHEVHIYSGRQYRGIVICRSMERPQTIVGFKIGHALVDELDVLTSIKAPQA